MTVIRHWSDGWTRNEFVAEIERLREQRRILADDLTKADREVVREAENARGAVEEIARLKQTIEELHESVDIERERGDRIRAERDALRGQ